MMIRALLLSLTLLLPLAACGGEEADAAEGDPAGLDAGEVSSDGADEDGAGDIGLDAGPLSTAFTFAVIADTHVVSANKSHDRLVAAVDWINKEAKGRDIELVLVLGDIAWGKGLAIANADLSALHVPWVPIIGDNEIAGGSEQAYEETFGPHLAQLATEFDDFVRAPLPVTAADGSMLWLQNMAFSHRGVRFVGFDTAARIDHFIRSEQGHLHEVPAGTWPWLAGEIAKVGDMADESVVLFSHIPMHLSPGGFDEAEMAQITALIGPVGHKVYAHFSGHYHGEVTEEVKDAGYTAYVTDATWDDEVRVRLVEVSGNGARFEYSHQLIDVPWTGP